MNRPFAQARPAKPDPAGTMRAAQITGPGRIEMVTLPAPEPGVGQVLVRLEGCGVCASNLEPWAGPDWMEFPTEPGGLGHEGWGTVEAVGEGVARLTKGQRVACLGQHSFASHDLMPESDVVPLPAALDGRPFPGEPLACAMNIFRRSGVGAGDRVAIVGIGFIGAALTRLCAQAGAEVIAISRRSSSLALARRMGAAHAVEMLDHHEIIREVRGLTQGRFCEVVIEAVGKQWPLDLAGEIVAEGGRLVIAGYHQDGPRQVNMQNWNWRGIDVINAHERDPAKYVSGIEAAVEAVLSGRLELDPLLTHAYPLDRLGEALDATRDKPGHFVKGYVTCS